MAVVESSPLVGSSRSRMLGLISSSWPTLQRLRSPPLMPFRKNPAPDFPLCHHASRQSIESHQLRPAIHAPQHCLQCEGWLQRSIRVLRSLPRLECQIDKL